MTSSTVLADAQFGTARILRPYDGFEAVYQGQPASTPIMLSEVVDPPGGDPLDPSASDHVTGPNQSSPAMTIVLLRQKIST